MQYNSQYEDKHDAYGGYAEAVRVSKHYTFKIPDNLNPAVAAPLLCAGVTVFSPLHHHGVKAGMKVGVVGIGRKKESTKETVRFFLGCRWPWTSCGSIREQNGRTSVCDIALG